MATRIDKLTKAQKARIPEWRDKWIAIGLKTGEADWMTFEKAVAVAYKKANLKVPKTIVRVQSPLVGAFAAPIANRIIAAKLGKKPDGAIDGDIGSAIRGAIAIDGAIRDAISDAVGGAVNDVVRGVVDGAPAYIKNEWHKLLGGQFWTGGWYWGSPSWVSYFTEVCGLKLPVDIQERAKSYQDIAQSVCWWWPCKDFIMVCNRPSNISRDEEGRLHSDIGKAIEWPDGWGFHVINGVRFDKNPELWEKIVNQTLTTEEFARIDNSEHQTIALQYLRPDRLLRQMNAKLIHKGIKGTKLYQVDNFMGTEQTEYCMWMQDWSTPREFIEWVPPAIGKQKDADLAQANAWQIPLEDYLLAEQRA